MGSRLTWRQICRSEDYRGRWIALDNCRYDQGTASPTEGDVVDADEDLAELCRRMREADKTHCAIAFCEDEVIVESSRQPAPTSWRPMQHWGIEHGRAARSKRSSSRTGLSTGLPFFITTSKSTLRPCLVFSCLAVSRRFAAILS